MAVYHQMGHATVNLIPEVMGYRGAKRVELEKRRQVRAIELLRGSLLGVKVDVGTEKHPEEVTPPAPQVPALLDVLALVLVYGTGPCLGSGDPMDGRPSGSGVVTAMAEVRKTTPKDDLGTRTRLWDRVREPIARALRIVGPMRPEAVADLAAQAEAICGVCGLDWRVEFLRPAAAAVPEPRSWTARRAS